MYNYKCEIINFEGERDTNGEPLFTGDFSMDFVIKHNKESLLNKLKHKVKSVFRLIYK